MVFRLDADPSAAGVGAGGVWDMGTAASLSHLPYINGAIYDAALSTARHDAIPHAINFATANVVYSVISTSSEWTNFENFTQLYTTATNTPALPATMVLGVSGGAGGMNGVVRELMIFGEKLSSTDRANLRAYLSSKWGTP